MLIEQVIGAICHCVMALLIPSEEAGCGWADDFGGRVCGNKGVLVQEHWRYLCGMQSFGESAGFGVSLQLMMPDVVSSLCYQKSLSSLIVLFGCSISFFLYTWCWHKHIIPSMVLANLHLIRGLIRQNDWKHHCGCTEPLNCDVTKSVRYM